MRLIMHYTGRVSFRDGVEFRFHCSDCGHTQVSEVPLKLVKYGEALVPVQPCYCRHYSPFGGE